MSELDAFREGMSDATPVAEVAEEKSKKGDKGSSEKKRRKTPEERMKERRRRERSLLSSTLMQISLTSLLGIIKKGKKIDPEKSMVPDPDALPHPSSDEVKKVMSLWRVDKLGDLTYTQFWQLVRDGHIERVRSDSLSCVVISWRCRFP